jgi:hypothetical protein
MGERRERAKRKMYKESVRETKEDTKKRGAGENEGGAMLKVR